MPERWSGGGGGAHFYFGGVVFQAFRCCRRSIPEIRFFKDVDDAVIPGRGSDGMVLHELVC